MIAVTGGSGFIGRNLLNSLEGEKINVDFTQSSKHPAMDPYFFLLGLENGTITPDVILHNGACSSTTVSDPHYVMTVNLEYSQRLLKVCMKKGIRLIYASSASVYGDGPFMEIASKKPKNLYALSKAMFDDYATAFEGHAPQIVGLRYFNVYGPHESHKGDMASVMYKFFQQVKSGSPITLFENSDKYIRDFIYVKDIVAINKFFIENKEVSGIFNAGTGKARSFYDIAKIYTDTYGTEINEVKMPKKLVGKYQEFTQSDNLKLNEVFTHTFYTLEEGAQDYIKLLESQCA
tara:strand:+ start:329 stop:1201 length:873 start_codon:yes stop_codon:yes gene_type:complete